MKTTSPNTFLTTKEVAELLKVNEKMVYTLVNDKGLPATKITGKWLFPRRLVEEWLDTHIVNYSKKHSSFSSDGGALLLAGSDDPLLHYTMNLFHKLRPGTLAFFSNQGSMGGLTSLRRGLCHIGVCHLMQNNSSGYNFDFANQEFDKSPVFINFSQREQGLLLAPGNPKEIEGINDLARKDISIVNRRLGTGTRLLFDYEIARSEITAKEINGYHDEVPRHLDAAIAVLLGRADAAPAIRAVAGMLHLDFLPIRWERFDLLINRERFFEKGVQAFLSLLHEEEFRQLAESLSGYNISLCGKMIYPDNSLMEEHP